MADAVVNVELNLAQVAQGLGKMQADVAGAMGGVDSKTKEGGAKAAENLGNAGKEGGSKFANGIKEHLDSALGHFGVFGKAAAGILAGGGILEGLKILGGGLHDFWEAGMKGAEQNENLLKAFMKTGLSAEEAEEKIKSNGSSISELKDKYLVSGGAMKEATAAFLQFGGSVDGLEESQKTILGLSEQLRAKNPGMDEAAAMRKAAIMLAKGDSEEATAGFQMLGINVAKTATQLERHQAVTEAAAAGLKGLAQAADSPLGNITRIENKVKDFTKAIGVGMVNAVGTGVGYLTQGFTAMWSVVSPIFDVMKKITQQVFVDIWEQSVKPTWESVKSMVMGLYNSVMGAFGGMGEGGSMFASIWSAVKQVLEGVYTFLAGGLKVGFEVAGLAIKAFVWYLTTLYGIVVDVAGTVIGWFEKLFQAFDDGSGSVSIFKKAWDGIVWGFQNFNAIVGGVMGSIDALIKSISTAGAGIGQFVHGLTHMDIDEMKAGVEAVGKVITGFGDNIAQGFNAGFDQSKLNEAMDKAGKPGAGDGSRSLDNSSSKKDKSDFPAKKTALDEQFAVLHGMLVKHLAGQQLTEDEYAALAKKGFDRNAVDRITTDAELKKGELNLDIAHQTELAQLVTKYGKSSYSEQEKILKDQLELKKISYEEARKIAEDDHNRTLAQIQSDLDDVVITKGAAAHLVLEEEVAYDAKLLELAETSGKDLLKAQETLAKAQATLARDERAEALKEKQQQLADNKDIANLEIDLIQGKGKRELAQENANYESSLEAFKASRKKILDEANFSGDALAQFNANTDREIELQKQGHERRLFEIQLHGLLERNEIIGTMGKIGSTVEKMAWDDMDAHMLKSQKNQKTVWFAMENDILHGVQDFISKRLRMFAEGFAAELLMTNTAELEKEAAQEGGIAKALIASGKWIAIALKDAGAALYSAAAAIFKFYASFGPFGIPLAAATIAAGVGLVMGVKSMVGAEKGGTLVGEGGPEIIAPKKDYSDLMSLLSIDIAGAVYKAIGASGGGAAADSRMYEELKKLNGNFLKSKSNVQIGVDVTGKNKLEGSDIVASYTKQFYKDSLVTA